MTHVFAEAGSSLQQVGGACPDDWIVMQGERPTADHIAQADGTWSLPALDYPAVIAARRYEAEVSGIDISGLHVATDDRSKLLINGAAVEAMLDPDYQMQWKTPAGFVELTASQVLAVARAVRAHVQACFDREAELLAELEAGTFTEAILDQGWPVPQSS